MVKVKFKTFSVIQLSALICAFLIYSGLIGKKSLSPLCTILNPEKICSLEGKVISNPSVTSNRKYYFLELELSKIFYKDSISNASGRFKVLCPKEIIEAHYPGKLYDKKGIVFEVGALVHLQGKADNDFFVCTEAEVYGWKNFFSKIRAVFRLQFKRLMYRWGRAGGLLLALLSGSREYTNPQLAEAFRLAGLSHVLALSGMHLSFFSGFALKSTKKIFGKKKSQLFSIILVLFFVWFAGLSPSLFRALLCFLIISFTHYLNLDLSMLSVLSLSFLIQVFVRPQDTHSLSFILSYSSLLGIILMTDLFEKIFSFFMIKKFSNAFSLSLSAQLFTSFITAIIFRMITPIGTISSVLTGDLFSIFLLFGFILVLLALLFPPLINVSGLLLNSIYIIIEKSVTFFANFQPIIIN